MIATIAGATLKQFSNNSISIDSDYSSVADLFMHLSSSAARMKLEQFRVTWEKQHGPTDLRIHYTCMWEPSKRTWLFTHYPKLYFDGLPPFLQDYIHTMLTEADQHGNLAEMPETLTSLYKAGHTGKTRTQRGR